MDAEVTDRCRAEVFEDHLRLGQHGSVEEDLARNYGPDVVMPVADGVHLGHQGVRELAKRLARPLPKATFTYIAQVVADEVASGVDGAIRRRLPGRGRRRLLRHPRRAHPGPDHPLHRPSGPAATRRAVRDPRGEVSTMSQTVTLQVVGMTCTGCEQRLGRALHRSDGVYETSADHRTGQVRVRFDPAATDRAALVERIVTAGYQVVGEAEEAGR
jgi:copper chaperone